MRYKAQWSKVAHFDANADGMEASHLVNYAGQLGLTLLTPKFYSHVPLLQFSVR